MEAASHANNPLVDKSSFGPFPEKVEDYFLKQNEVQSIVSRIWLKGRSLIVLKISLAFPAETIAISRPEVASDWDQRPN